MRGNVENSHGASGGGEASAAHGGGAEHLSLHAALGEGGMGLVGVLLLISIVDEFPRTAATVLAPNIQQSLGISDTVLLGMLGLVGVALVLSTLPAATLGDRIKRTHVVAAGTLVLTVCCVFVGASPNAFLMALALTGTGIGVGSRMPNASSLLADGYPLPSPRPDLRAGGVRSADRPDPRPGLRRARGRRDRRTRRLAVGLRDPRRADRSARDRRSRSCATLRTVSTNRRKCSGRCSRRRRDRPDHTLRRVRPAEEGAQLLLRRRGDRCPRLRARQRAQPDLADVGGAIRLFGLRTWVDAGDHVVGRPDRRADLAVIGERRFARNPPDLLKLAGVLLLAYGAAVVVALQFDGAAGLIVFYTVANAAQASSFVLTSPAIAAVVPARACRGQAFALVGMYLFLLGGFSATSSPARSATRSVDAPPCCGSCHRRPSATRPSWCTGHGSSCRTSHW